MNELATWARTLAALAAAWVIIRIGDRIRVAVRTRRMRRVRRDLHRSLIGAYETRRRYGSTPKFDAAIRAGEDAWLHFQPTSKGDLTECPTPYPATPSPSPTSTAN